MEKRLTTTTMLFFVGFIFMLVCAVGAFIYGVQIGAEKIEAKYAASQQAEGAADEFASAYKQQDLVSFYLTVFSPYREFQAEWLTALDKLSHHSDFVAGESFNDLVRLAELKTKEASSFNLQHSPLLGEAQVAYIRSIKLFKDVAEKAASIKSVDPTHVQNSIVNDKNYTSAVKESLDAQKLYYEAMYKWAATIDPNIPAAYTQTKPLGVMEWNGLPLTVKNLIIVKQLSTRDELYSFLPHDLTSRVDGIIANGQASRMKLLTIDEIVELLLNTNAVDSGDFDSNKTKFYPSETLPQLPFFMM